MPTEDAVGALYKRNLELAVVNKTLSLLRKLYQISLMALNPAMLSELVTETIRVDLNLEVSGVLLYDEENDTLTPFKFAQSERLRQALASGGVILDQQPFTRISSQSLLNQVVMKKQMVNTDLSTVMQAVVPAEKLAGVTETAHLKTILLYPLVTQDKVIGLLLLGLNRTYEALNDFEQESIASFTDVIAVALDKALLYQQLDALNQQLKALDKARAEFISIASHQLRTPPATIKWYVGAILSGDFGVLNQETKSALERVQSVNNAQISLIDDLLDASRIERGKLEFFFEMGSVEELAKAAYEQLVPQAEMHKLKLIYEPPAQPLPEVMLDKEKVRQVVNNFIDNAIKYTKQGSVTLHYELSPTDVVVKITDTGRGVAPDIAPTLFEKYTRGKDSATAASGLGLGLYVAKVVIEQNKGKIWVESPGEGKGSTFAFSLPIHNTIQPTSSVDLTQEQEEHK